MIIIETIALLIAEANNGEQWAIHYNEDQKNVWRERAKKIIEIIKENNSNERITISKSS
jgi:hypothetical protein